MPAIHINNVDIQVYEQQYTSPTLHVQNTDGQIYHAIVIPDGGKLFDASEKLVYSENSINTCQPVTLDAGMYRVELRGGAGGKQSRCNQGTGTTRFVGNTVSQIFKLPTQTTVHAFRGGDGNDSPSVTIHQVPGGGASGVDSMLIIGDRIVRANGAPGTRCMSVTLIAYVGGYGVGSRCQGGGGGVYTKEYINNAGEGYIISYSGGATECCAAGGGGANVSGGGIGGGEATASNPELKVTVGENATSDGGGNGGDAINLRGDSRTKNLGIGGKGGKNIYWQCAGHTAVSYGGGGGGGTCALTYTTYIDPDGGRTYSDCADGGNGASGSTDQSDTSYVKIYKIG